MPACRLEPFPTAAGEASAPVWRVKGLPAVDGNRRPDVENSPSGGHFSPKVKLYPL
jgi:hypothetical protein